MSVKSVIKVKDLLYKHQGQTILDRFDFTIPKASFVGVIGPNGGGKTTLLRLLMGLLEPTEGSIEVLGDDPRKRSVRQQLAYVPQRGGNIDPLFPATLSEVVQSGTPEVIGSKELNDLLERLGICHLAQRPIGQLSGGERQRALIARALIAKPKILFLDEPTDGLDPQTRESFFELLTELKSEGLTIIMVSHDVHTITKVADSALCLKHQLICHGDRECHLSGDELRNVFHEHASELDHHVG